MGIIHKTAIIEDGAIIGENVSIGAYSYIGKDVKIGANTTIGTHAMIEGKTTIGEDNQIFSHVSLGSIPQDLKFHGEDVELIIGDRNKIREFALFNPGTEGGGGKTIIGSDNLFMGYVHVAHDCVIGDHCIFANVATLAGHVVCEDYVVVGGLTPIHQFCHIGTQVMIGGGSVVTQDIPPFCLAEGNRAVLRGLNLNGLRRRMDDRSSIDSIKRAYKELFEGNRALAEVAQELLENSSDENVKKMAQFVLATKRGIPFRKGNK